MKEFVVVGRASASAVFREEEYIDSYISLDGHSVGIRLANHIDKGKPNSVTQEILFEARGSAATLPNAVASFTGIANTFSAILSLCANASFDNLQFELAYEANPCEQEREFFQRSPWHSPSVGVRPRLINKAASERVLQALASHVERPRLLRATAHYKEMLNFWYLEERLRCVVHAWVAVEALTKVALKREIARTSQDEERLAQALEVDVKTAKAKWKNDLDGVIRRKYIFHEDAETFRRAKGVSDAFEHSFKEFGELRDIAEELVVTVADHVRRAIFEFMDLDQATCSILFGAPFTKPKGPDRIVQYAFGKIVGNGAELAASDQAYPSLGWSFRFKPASTNEPSELRTTIDNRIFPRLAEGLAFRLERLELWDGSSFTEPGDVPSMLERAEKSKIKVSVATRPEIAGPLAFDAPGTEPFACIVGWFFINYGALNALVNYAADTLSKIAPGSPVQRNLRATCRAYAKYTRLPRGETKALIQVVHHIEVINQILKNGTMLIGWHNEVAGEPQKIIFMKPPSPRAKRAEIADRETIEQASLQVAELARRLNAWLQQLDSAAHGDNGR